MRRILRDGTEVVSALADPAHAVVGAQAARELQDFLEAHLADARPPVLARYSFPAGTALEVSEVQLSLPGRGPLPYPVRFDIVVIPHRRARWVVVPALDHTFHVGPGETLADLVAEEVQRVLATREDVGFEGLAFLPPRSIELVPLELSIGARTDKRADVDEARARRVLEEVGDPLRPRRGRSLVGREREARLLAGFLGANPRRSVVLVGEAGVGKTALFRGWLGDGDAPPLVYSTSGARLVAGASGLGELEARVRSVAEAAVRLDAVLYLPHLGDLLMGRGGEGGDPAAVLKRYVSEGRLRLVGELHPADAERLGRTHGGFMARLQPVHLEPLDREASREVLRRLDERASEAAPRLDGDARDALVELCGRHVPYEALPGAAVRAREEVCAARSHERGPAGAGARLGPSAVYDRFALRTGLPAALLHPDRALRAREITAGLRTRMVGQEEAVRRVTEVLCTVKAGLQPGTRPLATLLFVGPTGVGKTELARSLATYLFGGADRLAAFDMSEFTDPSAAERLIRGVGRSGEETEGLLTRRVRRQPFGVVLLDEIEKAHPTVFDLLLQVAGEGRLSDAMGRTVSFRDTILVLTSNLGAGERRTPVGLGARAEAEADHYRRAVEARFRPELVNRFDAVVPFAPLDRDEVARVTELVIARVAARQGFSRRGLRLRAEPAALEWLAERGHVPGYGARALRRRIEDDLVAPLARELARRGAEARNAEIVVRPTTTGALGFELRPLGREAKGSAGALRRTSALRRTMGRQLRSGPLAGVREWVEWLTADLARDPAGNAALAGDLHLQRTLVDRAEGLYRTMCDAEEVAMAAFQEGADANDLLAEVDPLWDEWVRCYAELVTASLPGRDGVLLLAQEIDGNRAFDYWLSLLLESAAERGWRVRAHFEGRLRGHDDGWPASRRWGPAREVEVLRAALEEAERPFAAVLLRVDGPYAGAWIGLEEGAPCWSLPGPDEWAHVYVRVVKRGGPLPDDAWDHPALAPLLPTEYSENEDENPRIVDPSDGTVMVEGDDVELPSADYWRRYEVLAYWSLVGVDAVADLYSEAWAPPGAAR